MKALSLNPSPSRIYLSYTRILHLFIAYLAWQFSWPFACLVTVILILHYFTLSLPRDALYCTPKVILKKQDDTTLASFKFIVVTWPVIAYQYRTEEGVKVRYLFRDMFSISQWKQLQTFVTYCWY